VPNSGLATISNLTLVLAIATYSVAMLSYACDFMFARFRSSAAAATGAGDVRDVASAQALADASDLAGLSFPADPADLSQLADVDAASGSARAGTASAVLTVAPGGPAPIGVTTAGSGHPPGHPALDWSGATRSRWPAGSWLRVAFGLTCVGALLHIIAILTRGLAEHRVPWGNMYEFIAAFTCAAVLTLLAASIRFRAYYMGLFVLLPVVLALAVDVLVIYTPAGSLVPALQSYWIAIHVTGMIISIGLFIFGAVVTVMYLLVARYEGQAAAGQARAGGILSQLPGATTLDRLAYRAILFAFPAWTFAVIAGAIWADHAWGRYWGWDPKETWSFITWLVYAAYLHARATAGWRGRRAAYIQIFGFVCLMFNLVGINLWVTGLHSYAGL
jgi:cytochrome c-type biogenesis protein CcsB